MSARTQFSSTLISSMGRKSSESSTQSASQSGLCCRTAARLWLPSNMVVESAHWHHLEKDKGTAKAVGLFVSSIDL